VLGELAEDQSFINLRKELEERIWVAPLKWQQESIVLLTARNEGQSAPRIVGVEFREIMRPRHTALTKE
jgi:hypothetical protein